MRQEFVQGTTRTIYLLSSGVWALVGKTQILGVTWHLAVRFVRRLFTHMSGAWAVMTQRLGLPTRAPTHGLTCGTTSSQHGSLRAVSLLTRQLRPPNVSPTQQRGCSLLGPNFWSWTVSLCLYSTIVEVITSLLRFKQGRRPHSSMGGMSQNCGVMF